MSENSKRAVPEKQADFTAFSILDMVLKNLHYILLSGAAVGIIVFFAVLIFVSPTYETHASFYVYNTSAADSGSVNSSDIQAAKNLAATYAKIFGSNAVVDSVLNNINDLKENQRKDLRNSVRVDLVTDTQLIEVTVKTDNADLAYQIADSFVSVAPKEATRIAKVGNVEVLDQPELPNKKTGPKTVYDALLGFVIGMIIAFGIICLKVISDTTLYKKEDVERLVEVTVLGEIPEIKGAANSKPWTLKEGGVISYEDWEAE